MFQQLPDEQPQEVTKLPIDYEPAMLKKQFKSDIILDLIKMKYKN